jgi:hypothetical protein
MPTSLRDSAATAVKVLQEWYGADSFASSTGLYSWYDPTLSSIDRAALDASGYFNSYQDMRAWWHSANAITALIDYMSITKDFTYLSVLNDTFNNAPTGYTVSGWPVGGGAIAGGVLGAIVGFVAGGWVGAIVGGIAGIFGGAATAASSFARTYYTNFLNQAYDDEGWWALAWIKAYDLTNDHRYLDMAVTIFNDMQGGWDGTCGGGLYWLKNHENGQGQSPYKNAIANATFAAVAASLYLRFKALYPSGTAPSSVDAYLSTAKQAWQWFSIPWPKGMLKGHLIVDGMTYCVPGGPVWTYNQGVILGALCDLFQSTREPSYLPMPNRLPPL